MISALERSIFDTVRYFDILALPVTAVQIWRSLVVSADGTGLRWGGQRAPSLGEVELALSASPYLRERLLSRWGYYFRRERKEQPDFVRARLTSYLLAQHKWKIIRRVAVWLAAMPAVRMIAASGSLALFHTRPESDLDIFVVARSGRIWTARLLLLAVAQLTGRRRKHWDRKAPDKVCLNHYVTDDALLMPAAVRTLYTAVQYTHLVPLAGLPVFRQWQVANESWIRRWLMYPTRPLLSWRLTVRVPGWARILKRGAEALLLEPAGAVLEAWAERWQRRVIGQHSDPGRGGRVAISRTELAFHPDSKVPAIIQAFGEEPGQGQLSL